MPNGGSDICFNCIHFEGKLSRGECTLRNIMIYDTHWTTCNNWREEVDEPHGPVYSILGYFVKGQDPSRTLPSYMRLPWYQNNEVNIKKGPDGNAIIVVRDKQGNRLEFSDPDAYMEFWKENTDIEDQ